METGTIKWFKQDKGYGFISPDRGHEDVWMHATELLGGSDEQLVTGVRVSYGTERGPKGPKAVNVRILAGDFAPPPGELSPGVEQLRQQIYSLAEKHVHAFCDELTDLLTRE